MFIARNRSFVEPSVSLRGGAQAPEFSKRRGFSLLMVMLSVSLCLVLTYGFLHSQAVARRIDENSGRRDQALAAARAGMSMALREMNSEDWAGVDAEISREVDHDPTGFASFRVTWHPVEVADNDDVLAPRSALEVVVRSVGTWQSENDANEKLERTIEALARIRPRLPGRDAGPADLPAASDLAANPSEYNQMQHYALVSTDSSLDSLTLEPGDRVDGDVWLRGDLELYRGPSWGSGPRNQYLSDVGDKFVDLSGVRVFKHPHPLAGRVDFYGWPQLSTTNDLNRVKAVYQTVSESLNLPTVGWSSWETYQVFEKGFTYSAAQLPETLSNVTLRPSADNPLGIFYRYGDLRIGDDVVVQGTVVVAQALVIEGQRVHIASFNWRGDEGAPIVDDRDLWQRLPAVVAQRVEIDRDAGSVIEGAVIAQQQLRGGGGTLEYVSANNVNIVATATATPLRQPYSQVHLQGSPSLGNIDGTGRYAVWLASADGTTGQWYRIVGVQGTQLTVEGEVEQATAVAARIQPLRLRYADIRGPLTGGNHQIEHQQTWLLTELLWGTLHTTWSTLNNLLKLLGLPRLKFIDWLSDPSNLLNLGYPLTSTGITLEPTFHVTHQGEASYRFEPPLFRPFRGSSGESEHEGYRWSVVQWRELE